MRSHENANLAPAVGQQEVSMPPNPGATRQRLVDAAETLFAERGIDGVSLREVNAAAGQRNATALQYHFDDRAGLLRAVLAKHHRDVEARRHALLDEYEAAGQADLRALAAALVRPVAAELANPDGGRAYVRIMAQLVNRPDALFPERGAEAPEQSTDRWRRLVAPLLPEVAVNRLHRRFTAIRIMFVELARRAELAPGRDERLFTSHLIDLVAAILEAPMSDETERLLAERPPRARPARRRAG
jgi:AcrR family transcriptional regulator